MMATSRPPVRLLVCGAADRRDDGAAIWAAAHLLPCGGVEDIPGVEVRRCGQLDVEHLTNGCAGAPTVIVDAAVGVAPGRVITRTFDELLAHPHGPSPHSSHALPIAQVIGVARELCDTPVDGVFVGIGAADVGFGDSLSRPVREGMGEFVVAIHKAMMRVTTGAQLVRG